MVHSTENWDAMNGFLFAPFFANLLCVAKHIIGLNIKIKDKENSAQPMQLRTFSFNYNERLMLPRFLPMHMQY